MQNIDNYVSGVSNSILGQPWRWRGGSETMASAIAQRYGVSDIIGRLLVGRGVTLDDVETVLNPTVRSLLPDPAIFCDMAEAAERISYAIMQQQNIVIFGDYDVDGATSCALLVRYFRSVGMECTVYIPDRLLEGYGPTVAAMERLKQTGAELVITVDCGTQSYEALDAARTIGLDIIVVDHHKASVELPFARAIINPNRFDETEGSAFGHLAAVGVAFLLVVALNRRLRAATWFNGDRPEPGLLNLLDVVALGTVCDVVPLTGLNRAFVTQGLKIMARREQIGLTALMDIAGLDKAPDAGALGFHLGPRINAGGRVGKSDLGVRLLTTSSEREARDIAEQLDVLNAERKAIEAMVQEQAQSMADQSVRSVITVAGEAWHPGVIGIVAGRLKERFGRPAVVIGLDGNIGKGSGRSIAGVDLGAAIIAAKEEGLISAGGGHAMAAGLTIARSNVAVLAEFLDAQLGSDIERAKASHGLLIDASTAPRGITGELARAVEGAGPYGSGWPAPRLACGPVRIVKADIVGADHVRIIATGPDGARLKAIAFRHADTAIGAALMSQNGQTFHLAGRIAADTWGGRDEAQLQLEDAAYCA